MQGQPHEEARDGHLTSIGEWRSAVDGRLASFRLAHESAVREASELKEAKRRIALLEQARAIVQEVAQQVQEQAHAHIASVVSRCLRAVYDDPYEFRILFEQKRGRTEARLVFERDGVQVDPMTASGGGPVDVAAFALRLSCIMLSRQPRPARVLILDEPFKFVNRKNLPRVRSLLESLAKEMHVQIVMITHIHALETGLMIDCG